MPVRLDSLPDNSYFGIAWRPGAFGHLKRVGAGSCSVYVPKREGGWEDTQWAGGSEVEPATEEQFKRQDSNTTTDGKPRERSEVENPVKLVWKLCDEMWPCERDDIVKAAVEQGVNISTAKTQFYAWKKKIGRWL